MSAHDFEIDVDFLGLRLDRFLRNKFDLTQGKICEFCKKGKILLNKKKSRFDARLGEGDLVSLLFDVEKKETTDKYQVPIRLIKDIKKAIVFENDKVVCVNKPFGLSVQGGSGLSYCLVDCLEAIFGHKIYVVHRIDKDTSGLVVFAKSRKVAEEISEKFRNREVSKKYIAILDGIPEKKSGTIKTYISKKEGFFNMMQNEKSSSDNGKIAITEYKVLSVDGGRTTVEMKPLTGRKHQLRLHSQYIKCPIVGDDKYGNDKKNKLQLFASEINIDGFCSVIL